MTAAAAQMSAPLTLQPGERILWQGRPNVSGYLLAPIVVVLVAIFLPILALLIVATAGPGRNAPLAFSIVLLPIAIVGVVLVAVGVYLWRQIASTEYVLTDRRAVIRGPYREAQIDLAQLGYVEIRRGAFGRSTITFAPPAAYGRYVWYSGAAFHSIVDGERVYALVNDAKARLRPA